MKNFYYFITTALPKLDFDQPPEISFRELEILLKDNLTRSDYDKVRVVRRLYDIKNIRAFWQEEELDFRGNLDASFLEEALFSPDSLLNITFPSYIYQFIDKYDDVQKRLDHFSELVVLSFKEELKHSSGFLHRYLAFERNLRLILLGFRAKQQGRDVALELQYEDPEDIIVAQILAQKDAQGYFAPEEFEDLIPLLENYYNKPLELQKALCEYRFNKIDEMLGFDLFSIDRILGYMIQLIMVENWHALDREQGIKVVDKIINK